MSEHYTTGRRYSYISSAWIFESSWNDKEEIAFLRAELDSRKPEPGQPAAVPVDNTCTKHNGFGHSDDCIYCNAEPAAGQSEPVAYVWPFELEFKDRNDHVGWFFKTHKVREDKKLETIPLYTHSIPAAPAVPDETGWLIEFTARPYPCWVGSDLKHTNNANEAFRFARKKDGEDFLDLCMSIKHENIYGKLLDKANYTITEHKWYAASPNQQGVHAVSDDLMKLFYSWWGNQINDSDYFNQMQKFFDSEKSNRMLAELSEQQDASK